MGYFRFILAIAVFMGHTPWFHQIEILKDIPRIPVFFILSGYSMSLYFLEKKEIDNLIYRKFIFRRLLKIFPSYWIVLILTIAMSVVLNSMTKNAIIPNIFDTYADNTFFSKFEIIFFNFFIIGQDISLLINNDNSVNWFFSFSDYYGTHSISFVPQIWAVSSFIQFYFICPFFIKKQKLVTILLFCILLLNISLNFIGYDTEFRNLFFPTQLIYFLMGIVAYYLLKKIKSEYPSFNTPNNIFFSLIITIIFYGFLPIDSVVIKQYSFYIFTIIIIPFLTLRVRKSNIDTYVGKLAYPVYLSHILCIVISQQQIYFQNIKPLFSFILTIVLAVVILQFVINPIDNYRNKYFSKT